MREILKKIMYVSPLLIRKNLTLVYEVYNRRKSWALEKKEYGILPPANPSGTKKNILVYHISGLSFGGTEKNLQIIANLLCENHNVFYMYSGEPSRMDFIDKRVRIIKFSYLRKEPEHPYYIQGMKPHIKSVVSENHIDVLITADSGHAQYPFNTILDIPIILINIFGSPALQKNIMHTIYISKEVRDKAQFYTGHIDGSILYIPSPNPNKNSKNHRTETRKKFGISESDFVFGRIGRGSDSIFDPIAILAFEKVVRSDSSAHYFVMSPMPEIIKIVNERSIPNVHFLNPSSLESDVWDFHYSIDCLAHFRLDGESCGLNIAESMLAENPIISHKSHIWNAHTEYLSQSFSRVVPKNDIEAYASNMKEFILIKKNDPKKWQRMKRLSQEAGIEKFSIESYSKNINAIFKKI